MFPNNLTIIVAFRNNFIDWINYAVNKKITIFATMIARFDKKSTSINRLNKLTKNTITTREFDLNQYHFEVDLKFNKKTLFFNSVFYHWISRKLFYIKNNILRRFFRFSKCQSRFRIFFEISIKLFKQKYKYVSSNKEIK